MIRRQNFIKNWNIFGLPHLCWVWIKLFGCNWTEREDKIINIFILIFLNLMDLRISIFQKRKRPPVRKSMQRWRESQRARRWGGWGWKQWRPRDWLRWVDSSDRPYSELIQHTDDDLGMDPAYSPMKRRDLSDLQEYILKNKLPVFIARKERLPIATKSEVVVNCCFKNIPIEKQATDLGVSPKWVQNIIYEFEKLKRIAKISRWFLWM